MSRPSLPISNIDYFLLRPEVRSLPATQIDDLVSIAAYTFYEPSTAWPEVLTISTADVDIWLSLATVAAYVVALPEVQRLIAVFDPRPGDTPLRRAYFYSCTEVGAAPFDNLMAESRARPCSTKELAWHIRRPEHENAVCQWVAGYKMKMAAIDKVVAGRQQNTAVENVYVLSAPDGCCLVCGQNVFGFAATTFGSADAAVMICAHLCEQHHTLAREESSVLQFILAFLGVELPFGLTIKEQELTGPIIGLMMDVVRQKTGAQVSDPVYDPNKNQYNVEIKFPSGFYVRLRLRSLRNYGYMLFDSNGVQLKRVDTADHHTSKLIYGPAHLHLQPDVCNANVTDSFTYGNPLFDLKLIVRLVGEAEEQQKDQ